jgi:hypothetical protein
MDLTINHLFSIHLMYRHVFTKILREFPEVMDKVSYELGAQKYKVGLSVESKVEDPMKTIENFNRKFNLNQPQKDAVEWTWPQEMGDTMFAVVNTYTRAARFKGLSAENSYQLQRIVLIFWRCSIEYFKKSKVG